MSESEERGKRTREERKMTGTTASTSAGSQQQELLCLPVTRGPRVARRERKAREADAESQAREAVRVADRDS